MLNRKEFQMPCNEELTLDDLVYIVATLPIAEEQINMLLDLLKKEEQKSDPRKRVYTKLSKQKARREGDYLIWGDTRLQIQDGRFVVKDNFYKSHILRQDTGPKAGEGRHHGHTVVQRNFEKNASDLEYLRTPDEPGSKGETKFVRGEWVNIDVELDDSEE